MLASGLYMNVHLCAYTYVYTKLLCCLGGAWLHWLPKEGLTLVPTT